MRRTRSAIGLEQISDRMAANAAAAASQ